MRKTVYMIPIVLILMMAPLAYAQMGMGSGPRFQSEFKPVVGGWAEYQMKGQGSTSKMKMAIVGKEGDAFWYETVMEGGREGRTITKMLVSGDPSDQKNIKKFIVKTGNEPAMEMPVQMMGAEGSKGGGQRGKAVDKGTETVKVPAGTFKAQHLQYQDSEGMTDVWVHKDVVPYGMVKSQSKDMEMVLLGHGTGAKTQITETPQKFEMPQMPQMPPMRR